jgi:hypothetical protein
VRSTIRHGLPGGAPSGPGFSNHLFKVLAGNRWVRLNYNVLGQHTLDDSYFGLLTHILTATSMSEVPMAETWGTRYATYPKAGPALSSINPYQSAEGVRPLRRPEPHRQSRGGG